jgi:hypothetical protein
MERSKFVSGGAKQPRPKCSTKDCVGSVYSKTINHCDDCIAKFNKSVDDARPINILREHLESSMVYNPQVLQQPPVANWDSLVLGEPPNVVSETITERVSIPIELPRPVDRDFDF